MRSLLFDAAFFLLGWGFGFYVSGLIRELKRSKEKP